MNHRTVPHDPDAERALLGSMLLSRLAVDDALAVCLASDFYRPRHGAIFGAMTRLYHRGAPLDPTTVAAELSARSELDGAGGKAYLLELAAHTPASANSKAYASIVTEHGAARRTIELGSAIADAGYRGELDTARTLIEHADDAIAHFGTIEPGVDAADLVTETVEYDWLVPGLLERGDRMILSGPEGYGKSTLLRQLGVHFASGMNPWSRASERPLRVLHVDLENSRAQTNRAYSGLMRRAGSQYQRGHLHVVCRPQGMNVAVQRDYAWLDHLCAHHRPEVVILGPLYKAFTGTEREGKQSEEAAERCALAFDRLRVRHGFALLLEAHSPHDGRDNYRPIGSTLWLRWPEFGIGIKPEGRGEVVKLLHWRGARDRSRYWPETLTAGGRNNWPWEPPAQPAPRSEPLPW